MARALVSAAHCAAYSREYSPRKIYPSAAGRAQLQPAARLSLLKPREETQKEPEKEEKKGQECEPRSRD